MKQPVRTYLAGGSARLNALKLACLLLLICCCVSGCGYRLAGDDGISSPLRGKTIAVPILVNKTYRPNLETILAGSLREQIAWRSGGRNAAAAESADLILTGAVLTYTSTPISYSGDDRIKEYRATMSVEVSLVDRVSGEVMWKGTRSSVQDYPVIDFPINNRPISDRITPQNRIALQQNSEDAAVREICRRLAQDIYEKVTDRF